MSRKIYKYKLQPTEFQELELPFGAHILSLQLQNGVPTIWCEIDPDGDMKQHRYFCRFATGFSELPQNAIHIATIQEGVLVWHWYELFQQ